ncbi:universal stress protein [Cesiribacter andamanensis]|uniref:Universal stress protein family protein n=1 Tax=Cesiribacter andamanensis AMV16 TaxID=1279009 RepID=M7NY86_9BACT|nr:universal stress protein [Cesiribacter andamanensis]EMR03329.1 Universal stress protein family protein [Cesiribacter andamanensis AMV16]
MKKIVVPTDLSELSGYALTLAQKFARQSGAEILALTVVPTPADAVFTRDGELAEDEDFDLATLKKEMQKSRERLAGWISQSGIAATPIVKAGNLTDQILHCTKKEGIDLVVMGTHGLNGLRELIADSVTEQVVRQSSVPVLSLKCDRSDLEIKNIVLASKFDAITPRQIGFIKELQQAFGATIHLLRIVTPSDFKSSRYLQEHMEAFAAANGLTNVAHHIWADKDVESGILHFTQDRGMDMICIGVEKDKLSKLFQKHVSSALVNHVFYPVLTFKI